MSDLTPRMVMAIQVTLFTVALVMTILSNHLTLVMYARMLAWVSLLCWIAAVGLGLGERFYHKRVPTWLKPAVLFFNSMLPFAVSTLLAWLAT